MMRSTHPRRFRKHRTDTHTLLLFCFSVGKCFAGYIPGCSHCLPRCLHSVSANEFENSTWQGVPLKGCEGGPVSLSELYPGLLTVSGIRLPSAGSHKVSGSHLPSRLSHGPSKMVAS